MARLISSSIAKSGMINYTSRLLIQFIHYVISMPHVLLYFRMLSLLALLVPVAVAPLAVFPPDISRKFD